MQTLQVSVRKVTRGQGELEFWYLPGPENNWPVVAEFSFDYDTTASESELEMYPIALVEGVYRFFSALQNQAG